MINCLLLVFFYQTHLAKAPLDGVILMPRRRCRLVVLFRLDMSVASKVAFQHLFNTFRLDNSQANKCEI